MFKVVRGNPTPEELAAALAVVQARASAASSAAAAPERLDEWADPARNVPGRGLPHPGPTAWRSSYWPR
ncbi:acyl-CoA carboxylase subunit epsilon [Streptomyces xinghaiensis]|uniref:acyl-CoA carboxylase subunit epsilon n=1 Tax=Streptomyces xinghaiensis TaxID=1038928 RepID=UPI000BAFE58E|nr:acyl-CoA carboxylase subunit epsilon [Streptomyces xinghaiensis]